MMKKLTAALGALVLALTLTACGSTVEQLPTLSLETSSTASGVSETSGVESGSQETAEPQEVADTDFEDSLTGLCDFLEANSAVTGDPTEMAYETIGAVGGYRYRFLLGGSTVQVEVYQYDLDNLNEQGQSVLDSVRDAGSFHLLDKDVPATLSASGKYLLIYTDSSTSEANTQQRERVTQLFVNFKA